MKRANCTGSVKKLSGNRRKPYIAVITSGYVTNEITLERRQVQKPLGYFETWIEAEKALDKYYENPYDINADKITFEDVYKEWCDIYYSELKNESTERSNRSA